MVLRGNAFRYILNYAPPVLYRMPQKTPVPIAWSYEYEIHYQTDGGPGGAEPTKMEIWIKRLKPGASYRLEFCQFSADFIAGTDIHYERPEMSYHPGLFSKWISSFKGKRKRKKGVPGE